MLQSFNIKVLVDIRSLPSSSKFPQFNKEDLEVSLEENGIQYMYFADLGGRRKVKMDSKNNRWHNDSFKAYADYLETDEFKNAIVKLEKIASEQPTAYMCAEVVWWRCHRSMVSDYLNPDCALEIYSEEILLHIYFSTHFSVLKVAKATYVGEKFRAL